LTLEPAAAGWPMLARRGCSVCALDLGWDSLLRASRRARERRADIRFVLGDLYRLPFPDGCFDAVIACEILEHLDSPGNAVREIARALSPGGIIVLSTPCRERIEMTLCIHCNRKTPVNAHLHSFDERSLAGILNETGFSVLESRSFINRPMERIGFTGLSAFLPHALWRAADRMFCRLLGRESYIAVKAVRNA